MTRTKTKRKTHTQNVGAHRVLGQSRKFVYVCVFFFPEFKISRFSKPCVTKRCPADGVWRIWWGSVSPLREHLNSVHLMVLWGSASRHSLLDTVKKHMVKRENVGPPSPQRCSSEKTLFGALWKMSRIFCENFCGHFPWKLKDENVRKISPKFRRNFRRSLAKNSQELRSGGLSAQENGFTKTLFSLFLQGFLSRGWF